MTARHADRIDGYLSRKAQEIDPTALVVYVPNALDSDVWTWLLRRPGHPDMRLGTRADSSFGEAQQALSAWIRAQRAAQTIQEPVCRNCGQNPCRPTCVISFPVQEPTR